MINALVSSFFKLLKKPSYFIPALIGMILTTVIFLIFSDSYFNLIYKIFVFGEIPQTELFNLPFYLLSIYGADLFAITLSTFISISLGFFVLYVYSTLLNDSQLSVSKAITRNFEKISEIIGLSLFVFVVGFLYAGIGFILALINNSFESLGLLVVFLVLLWIITGIYIYTKLAFTPLIMNIEKQNLKQALSKNWKQSENKILEILIFLTVLSAIVQAMNFFVSTFADAIGVEVITLLVLIIGLGFTNAYYNISFIKYFLNSKK